MLLTTLMLSLPAVAVQEPAPAPVKESARIGEQSPAERIAGMHERYDASELSYPERFAAFEEEFAKFAADHPGTKEGMEAEMFLLTGTWWQEPADRAKAATERIEHIIEVYGETPYIADAVEWVGILLRGDVAQQNALMKRIAEGSPHAVVKATVLFFQAKGMKGEDREKAFTQLAEKYGKLKLKQSSFAALADAYLNPHPKDSLQIGKPAPEITGVDLDGNPMKVSDFRGKVVVLDFWGDW